MLRLPDRSILVVSVYVEPQDAEALRVAICELHQVIRETRRRIGTRVDVVIAGATGMINYGEERTSHGKGKERPIRSSTL